MRRRHRNARIHLIDEVRDVETCIAARCRLAHENLARLFQVLAACRFRPAIVDFTRRHARLARSARARAAFVREADAVCETSIEDALAGRAIEVIRA